MRAAFLDFATVGPADLDTGVLTRLLPGVQFFDDTPSALLASRVADAEVVIINKARLTGDVLRGAPELRLVCLAATGIDTVDVATARERGLPVWFRVEDVPGCGPAPRPAARTGP
jgi:glycerate dehydrogenase